MVLLLNSSVVAESSLSPALKVAVKVILPLSRKLCRLLGRSSAPWRSSSPLGLLRGDEGAARASEGVVAGRELLRRIIAKRTVSACVSWALNAATTAEYGEEIARNDTPQRSSGRHWCRCAPVAACRRGFVRQRTRCRYLSSQGQRCEFATAGVTRPQQVSAWHLNCCPPAILAARRTRAC